jgi:imidazolonepropionase-like amidohydrolase
MSPMNPPAPKKKRSALRIMLVSLLSIFVVLCAGIGYLLVPIGPPATVPAVAPLDVTPAVPAPVPAALALVNGLLIDGSGAAPVADAVVLIRDGRFEAAGPRGQVTIPPEYKVIDVQGATILPGLINAHVHYAYDVARLKTWAYAGVTTVREMGVIVPGESLDKRYMLRDNSRIDPYLARIVAVSLIVSPPKGYGYLYETSPEDARKVALKAIGEGAELIKLVFADYRIPFEHWPLLPLEDAKALVQAAHERGLLTAVHIHQAKYVSMALDAGVDQIAHMPADDSVPDDVIQRAVAAKVMWTPTLEMYSVFGRTVLGRVFGADAASQGAAKGAIDNLRRVVAAGGEIALGTDYGGTPSTFQDGLPIHEMELMQQAGMTPMQILVAATSNAARACGKADQLGTITPGKIADVLVVNGNPLDDLHRLQDVRLVIKGGTIIRQEAKD